MTKQKFKLFLYLFGILLFMVNCETEDNFESIETIIENTTTTLNTDAEKINFLLVGLKPEIIKYNRNKGIRNLFVKKFGELDGGNSIIIKFPNKDKDFIIVIPFKNNKLKNKKVLIAYYKNGIRKYKFFNTSYSLNDYISAPFFLTNLDLLFKLVYQNSNNRSNCYSQFVGTDYSICVDIFIDSCTDEMYYISNLGEFESCGGELDEIEIDGNTDDDEGDNWDWDDNEGDYDWENDNNDQDEDWDWSEEEEFGEEMTSNELAEILTFEQDYRARMSLSERTILDSLNRVTQLKYLQSAFNAETLMNNLYQPSVNSPCSAHNGQGDAFRHAVWNALSTVRIGETLTSQLTTAHEDRPIPNGYTTSQYNKEKQMDLYNNARGRELAFTTGLVLDAVIDAKENGNLRYLSNLNPNNCLPTSSSNLIFTN